MPAEHPFLKFILPAKAFAALKAGTKQWLIECPCGHKRDLWNAGGARYRGTGQPRQLWHCPACDKSTMHKVRQKTQAERHDLA